ncbi:3582_t:CDS:2 [Diversispora eburnea]|uniref:3582_t:CDS:1 n=1 Tax=Diversispora eburnea TaxID=1213867 RepID=A0A9N9AH09_9GLOM|nr:3582_t:CDS:2 [Diversispora eburnea]
MDYYRILEECDIGTFRDKIGYYLASLETIIKAENKQKTRKSTTIIRTDNNKAPKRVKIEDFFARDTRTKVTETSSENEHVSWEIIENALEIQKTNFEEKEELTEEEFEKSDGNVSARKADGILLNYENISQEFLLFENVGPPSKTKNPKYKGDLLKCFRNSVDAICKTFWNVNGDVELARKYYVLTYVLYRDKGELFRLNMGAPKTFVTERNYTNVSVCRLFSNPI